MNTLRVPLILLVLLVTACGPSAKAKTWKTTLVGVNAAREALIVWDEQVQLEIVQKATSREEGEARLAAHRAERAKLVAGFEAVYRALAIAAMDLDRANLIPVVLEAKRIVDLVQELKGP